MAENLSYGEQYPYAYRALKKYGLSALYALRVLVDAKRGCPFSLSLLRLAKEGTHK